jgi:cytochrome c-type biogenesis protein CcmH
MSEIAGQMRQEITQMVQDGKSDKEIRDYYVRLYGQQVLAEPEGSRRLMLYGIPVTIAVAGIVFVMAFLRKALRTKNDGLMITRSVSENSSSD